MMKKKNAMAVGSVRDRQNIRNTVPGDYYADIDLEIETNNEIVTNNAQMRNITTKMEIKRNSPRNVVSETPGTGSTGTIAEALGFHTISDIESSSSQENEGSENGNCDSEYINPYQPLQVNDANKMENPYTETQAAILSIEKGTQLVNADDEVYSS